MFEAARSQCRGYICRWWLQTGAQKPCAKQVYHTAEPVYNTNTIN